MKIWPSCTCESIYNTVYDYNDTKTDNNIFIIIIKFLNYIKNPLYYRKTGQYHTGTVWEKNAGFRNGKMCRKLRCLTVCTFIKAYLVLILPLLFSKRYTKKEIISNKVSMFFQTIQARKHACKNASFQCFQSLKLRRVFVSE